MIYSEICNGIHYVGVNDRTTTRFEGIWPLPYGVTYNSYIVKGNNATALIDGVEISHSQRLIDRIKSAAPSATTWSLTIQDPCRHCATLFLK